MFWIGLILCIVGTKIVDAGYWIGWPLIMVGIPTLLIGGVSLYSRIEAKESSARIKLLEDKLTEESRSESVRRVEEDRQKAAYATKLKPYVDMAKDVADLHGVALAKKYVSGTYKDDYGNRIYDAWLKELDYFMQSVVLPKLMASVFTTEFPSPDETQRAIHDIRVEISDYIHEKIGSGEYCASTAVSSPEEYEIACAEILKRNGWDADLTPRTGDQGVDVVARKESFSVGIQCKHYSSPVGNSAVQEVAAGIKHYNLKHGVVLAESGYTQSARELAATNGVLLLSLRDLEQLESFVR